MFNTPGMLLLSGQFDQVTGNTYTDWLQIRLDSSWIKARTSNPIIPQGANWAGTGTNTPVRLFARSLGKQSDQAGHIIANILSGNGRQKWNIFPIDGPLNRGKMSSAEEAIRTIIYNVPNPNLPNTVTLTVKMQYTVSPTRPFTIHMPAEYGPNICYWELVNP